MEKKRVELDDPIAIYTRGCDYRDATNGYPRDYNKALEHFHRAGELGYANSYCSIGIAYYYGRGVEVDNDKKKANHYYELAAVKGGDALGRHNLNLGIDEGRAGNMHRALKHFMIAVGCGCNDSVEQIKQMYTHGQATKDDYTAALQLYQTYLAEIKSKQRDEAAAAHDQYRYY